MKKLARYTIYNLLGTIDTLLARENNLVVYCYHNISHNPWLFNVSPQKFKKQMEYLASVGNFISLADLEQYLQGKKTLPKKSFAITFDDGYRGIKYALPTTRLLGISPAVFVLADKNAVDRSETVTNSALLSDVEVQALITEGWDVGSHGLTHKKLTKLSKADMQKEVQRASNISYFAYPHGKYNNEIMAEVKAQGYSLAFSMNNEQITANTNKFAIPRVGVMGNHTDAEFRYLASPSVLAFRKAVNGTFLRKYI